MANVAILKKLLDEISGLNLISIEEKHKWDGYLSKTLFRRAGKNNWVLSTERYDTDFSKRHPAGVAWKLYRSGKESYTDNKVARFINTFEEMRTTGNKQGAKIRILKA